MIVKKPRYKLSELIAQCDKNSPMLPEMVTWEQAESVGLEQDVMGDQLDIRKAVLTFGAKLRSQQYEMTQLVLFGSRARGDYHAESDADVAVFLRGAPGDFLETKLAMAGIAFDVLLKTEVLIQALPVWEADWRQPERYSNPALLKNVALDGVIIWRDWL